MQIKGDRLSAGEVRGFFDRRAAAVDGGAADPRVGLRHLAAHGMLGAPELRDSFALIRCVASSDLASAFSLWAHTMVLECLATSVAPELLAHAARLRHATAWGSTAMAPAIKHLAGLGELPVSYRREGAELVLDGRIPWASNLFDEDVVLVLSARSATAGGEPVVLAVDGRHPAIQLGRPLPLLALAGTASSSVELRGARVRADAVISSDFAGYMKSMKPRLLLLQTAYCLGLASAGAAAGAERLGRAAAAHRREHGILAEEITSLGQRADALVSALDQAGGVAVREVVEVRLRAAQAAQSAVQLELRLAGGVGFVATSPTSRRYREAAFLPVQTPTEGQLLSELG